MKKSNPLANFMAKIHEFMISIISYVQAIYKIQQTLVHEITELKDTISRQGQQRFLRVRKDYRLSEAAELLGISKKTLRKRIKQGEIEISRRSNGDSGIIYISHNEIERIKTINGK